MRRKRSCRSGRSAAVVRVHLAAMKQDADADIVRSYTSQSNDELQHLPTYQSEHLHTMSLAIRNGSDPYATRESFEVRTLQVLGVLTSHALYVFISVEIHTSLRKVQLPVLTGTRLRAYELTRLTSRKEDMIR
jgi:hypothetical protein